MCHRSFSRDRPPLMRVNLVDKMELRRDATVMSHSHIRYKAGVSETLGGTFTLEKSSLAMLTLERLKQEKYFENERFEQ